MSKPFHFKHLPEDAATYVQWRRGVSVVYGCIGLVVIAVVLAAHFSRSAFNLAGN
jgi:FlaG/FlaF family flagellin (archaellin)